ncbi:MAG: beta-phosphoglucomutase family hydrolase [Candidatus Lokiarchaeota archaeon]|nr:beta-phosphoglucomutase family hydrolase [Candidatus Lokiarchaeota archaeon]MBD3339610.1 beta-phosphoglucomutase family hydrolase [Candidatus Lokiarchaeota archaeon]
MYEDIAVIFDMDGVLADTGPIHFESWKKMATQDAGVEFTREFFEKTFGQQTIPITKKLLGSKVSEHRIKNLADLKEEYYREMVADELEPLPGVIDLIINLKKKKFKLAVGSSGPRKNVELLLNSLHIQNHFDIVIAAEDIEKGKPAPDVFLHVANSINIPPKNCLVIEDAPVGIEAAKRAGMKTIALTTTHNKEELKEADLIIENLTEVNVQKILKILKK